MSKLYCAVTNTSNILNAVVTGSHDSPVTTASIEAVSTSLTLGDQITVDLGYTDAHAQVFTGYVKQISQKTPNNTVEITAYDELVRAQDYFIASTDPNQPFKRKGILAENLVRDLIGLAGLTSYDYTPTYFTFGINNEFEINLVSVYDYIRTICDTITWSIWADQNGTINFKNRKPYVMDGTTGQPGDVADVPTGYVLSPLTNCIEATYSSSEHYLRNRVVVYGTDGVFAEAKASSSLLPPGFYKSAVLAMSQIIDTQSLADDIAAYNLDLLNRVMDSVQAVAVGDSSLSPRTVITATIPLIGVSGNWYVHTCEHQWGSAGYVTNLTLRRLSKVA